jgi:hypothetical protein
MQEFHKVLVAEQEERERAKRQEHMGAFHLDCGGGGGGLC